MAGDWAEIVGCRTRDLIGGARSEAEFRHLGIKNSPNTKHAYSEQCGNCLRIVGSIPDPDEAGNDIKKYFRYV